LFLEGNKGMEKLKILIDTSVVCNLYAPEIPDKQEDTLRFWEDVKAGKYEVYLSSTLFKELEDCKEPKKSIFRNFLTEINFNIIEAEGNDEISKIENEIIKQNIITENHRDDCSHIACAVIAGCDIIVSWNCRHIVRRKTINGVRAINLLHGYKSIDIYQPSEL
jgi:predicted nucleic acid-binding protein